MSIAPAAELKLHCAGCGIPATNVKATKRGAPKLPRGFKPWKQIGGLPYCNKCVKSRFQLRALQVPVGLVLSANDSPELTEPVTGRDGQEIDPNWIKFRKALARGWRQAREIANWHLTYFRVHDIEWTEDMTEWPKEPWAAPKSTYQDSTARFPASKGYNTDLIASIAQSVAGRYRAKRWAVICAGPESLASLRRDQPYPVRTKGWSVRVDPDDPDKIVIRVSIAKERFHFTLRMGPGYNRQWKGLRQLLSGEAERGPLELLQHRRRRVVISKIIGHFPRAEEKQERPRKGDFVLRTDAEVLLYGIHEHSEEPFIKHGNKLKGLLAKRERQLLQNSQNLHHEQRVPARRRGRVVQEQRKTVENTRDQIKQQIAQYASVVVGFADRHRFSRLVYDDRLQTYSERLPWYDLAQAISWRCQKAGIEFIKKADLEAALKRAAEQN